MSYEPQNECDPVIYQHGVHVATIIAPKPVIEAIVAYWRELSGGASLDWHYVAGRGTVRCIGDAKLIKQLVSETYIRVMSV